MQKGSYKVGLVVIVSLFAGVVRAAVPVIVKDINAVPTGSTVQDSYPANLLALNGRVYFAASTGVNGRELYVTDGTTNGTTLIKNIYPGSGDSSPASLTMLDATHFVFSANDQTHGRELWISDGTTGGTQMVKDINPNGSADSNPVALTNIGGGIVLFWASDGVNGTEVWRTDGTTNGTYRLSDISPGASPAIPNVPGFVSFAGKVFFSAQNLVIDGSNPAGQMNTELYTTDGTNAASTALFKEINQDSLIGSCPQGFIVLSPTQMLFRANDGVHGDELWTTNGTAGGTVLLKDIHTGPGGSALVGMTLYNGKAYFAADGGAGIGRELYVSDGTPGGTRLVKDIYPGRHSSNPQFLTVCNGKLFFNAYDPINGIELWVSDGTTAGTSVIDSVPGIGGLNPFNLVSINFSGIGQRLLFQGANYDYGTDSNPWISDGTPEGTMVLSYVYQHGPGFIVAQYTPINGGAVFSATDYSSIGTELWKTDGTDAGTALLADIAVPSGTADSNPTNLTAVGSTLFLQADDGVHGAELWKYDGTSSGTVLVKDINSSAASSPQSMVNAGGTLFFQANDGVNGAELWKSNGIAGGTVMIKDINSGSSSSSPVSLTYNGSVVLFAANNGSSTTLWSSDGSSANTVPVLDSGSNPISSPSNLFAVGSDVYMSGSGAAGTELYRYRSGTANVVADINPTGSSFPGPMVKLGNLLLYRASDGVNGSELWSTDVTSDSTVMVKDINPGSANSNPQLMAVAGSKVFFVATDGTHGFELWVTDGTSGGTSMVKDINPGSSSGVISGSTICPLGNKVVFAGSDGTNGLEPWISDGTAAGTMMLKDIAPPSSLSPFGSGLSSSTVFFNANGTVYFAANDGINVHGNELWKTDGTPAGTVLAADINVGAGVAGWSNPASFLQIGTTLFFSASDGAAVHGRELFKLDVTP